METRSRSRSKTPVTLLGQSSSSKSAVERSSAGEQEQIITMTRVTRSTTYKSTLEAMSEESAQQSSSYYEESGNSMAHNTRQRASLQKRQITSDYSSEDGEGESEVTSSFQQRNGSRKSERLKNGSVSPALRMCLETDEYWNKYPKTDYTYSRHSKDRYELEPGVVIMPNMSRKSIRGETSPSATPTGFGMISRETNTTTLVNNVQRNLFNTKTTSSTSSYYMKKSVFISTIIMISTIITWIYYKILAAPNRMVFSFGRWLHRSASKVLQIDAKLLRGNQGNHRTGLILIFLLLPLLLLLGWWLLSSAASALTFEQTQPTNNNLVYASLTPLEVENIVRKIISEQHQTIPNNEEQIKLLTKKIISVEEEMVTFKNLLEQYNVNNARNTASLLFELRKCCRRSFVEIENHFRTKFGFMDDKNALLEWFKTFFVVKSDLDNRFATYDQKIADIAENNMKFIMEKTISQVQYQSEKPGDDEIRRVVKSVLDVYDADKTGMVDYALESAGGQVLSTRCTEVYQGSSAVIKIFGLPVWYPSKTPRTVLTPDMTPGNCWAFQNFPGYLVVQLWANITVDAISYEHVNRRLVPDGRMDSAPKEFRVYGLREENDRNPVLIGEYFYDVHGDPLQFFASVNSEGVFNLIEIQIISNHGNPNYTCLYRFRVHGHVPES